MSFSGLFQTQGMLFLLLLSGYIFGKQIQNSEADELEAATAKEFVDFLITDDAKEIFQKYYFDTDVED